MLSMMVTPDERPRPDRQDEYHPSEPLIQDSVVIAEILSYVLTSTREFARLRQVCKSWKNEILPYFLEYHSHHYPSSRSEFYNGHQQAFFLRICDENDHDETSALPAYQTNVPYRQSLPQILSRSPRFLPELVHLANYHRFAGKLYDDLDVWYNIWGLPTLDFWESVTTTTTSHALFAAERNRTQVEVSELDMVQEEGRQTQPELMVGQSSDDISVQSMLVVREAVPSSYTIAPQRVVEGRSDDYFASLCRALVETDSWPQFCSLGEEALDEGMFLSMEDYYETMVGTTTMDDDQGSFAFESRIVPVIFTVRFHLPPLALCSTDDRNDSDSQETHPFPKQVCFQVRIPKPTLEDDDDRSTTYPENDDKEDPEGPQIEAVRSDGGDAQTHAMVPFVKYLPLHDNGDNDDHEQMYVHARFVGYNVQPVDPIHLDEDLKAEDDHEPTRSRQYTCHVPMSFAWWELMQLLVPAEESSTTSDSSDHIGLEDQGADSFLPLDWLRTTCKERSVREGVGIMDGLLDYNRQKALTRQLDALATDLASTAANPLVPEFSFRQWQERSQEPTTHHIAGRNALVDPDLYSYSERHSILNLSVLDVPPCSFYGSHLDPPILQTVDYWGRSYTGSIEYQWLPTYFDVSPDGKRTTIRDYVNNLVPRQRYEALYDSLSQLFSLAIPLLESVFSYCRVIKRSHIRMVESNQQTWHPVPPSPLKEEPSLLRGQSLQVITEIEEYDLLNEEDSGEATMEESWHVKGMPHEEIVATAMYVLPVEKNQQGSVGTIQFQRAFFNDEANYLFSAIDRDRPPEVEAEVHTGLLPLGQADLIPGRLLVFPNCHVSKRALGINKQSNTSACAMQKLRMVIFYLVNPEKRIISTREVGMQQGYTQEGTIPREQARTHRIELQRERENSIPDWNVREIHLL